MSVVDEWVEESKKIGCDIQSYVDHSYKFQADQLARDERTTERE